MTAKYRKRKSIKKERNEQTNKQTTGPKHERDLDRYTKTDKRLYTRYCVMYVLGFRWIISE